MGLSETIVYALLQGMTEFLPISSSGHLALLGELFFRHNNQTFFFVVLHLGTLFAVLIFFRNDIIKLIKGLIKWLSYQEGNEIQSINLLLCIIVSTMVTGLLVFPFKDFVEDSFKSTMLISINFLITGAILLSTYLVGGKNSGEVNIKKSIIIGISQAIAVLPGISRSGATISTAILSGVRGEEAFRFSFLISIPAVLGAAILEMPSSGTLTTEMWWQYIMGFITSFLSGIASLYLLGRIINKNKLYYFSFYCFLIGFSVLIAFYSGVK